MAMPILSLSEDTNILQHIEKSKVLVAAFFGAIVFTGGQAIHQFTKTSTTNLRSIHSIRSTMIRQVFLFFYFNTWFFYTILLIWLGTLIRYRVIHIRNKQSTTKDGLLGLGLLKWFVVLLGCTQLIGWIVWVSILYRETMREHPSESLETLYNNITPPNLFVMAILGSIFFDGIMGEEIVESAPSVSLRPTTADSLPWTANPINTVLDE